MVETKTETETRILTIFEKETARDRPLDVETEVETKISGWYASVTYNKHGYAISSRYSCKYTVCKLSSSSHLPIPLLILHESLYFVLRLGYILLRPSTPPLSPLSPSSSLSFIKVYTLFWDWVKPSSSLPLRPCPPTPPPTHPPSNR